MTMELAGAKQALVFSATQSYSLKAFSAKMMGAYMTRGKWILE